ncbi:MAG: dockerin type I repeat-containing protein [Ruminococcus sp.]|nr:dockerin type I repeat-containing protein [Ruminococcus sp.]MDE6848501.1 dockerin type I repeat-containing protein [Ruminococcus sp.]MDE7138222.1 dockerin type I repeat-containing protein [Ruminococcus sp.]
MCLNYGEDVYFGDTITMLCLIVDDGGWIVPQANNISVRGDVNADGQFNISDAVIFQKWLLSEKDTKLADWKAADLYEDGRLDVFDFCIMKKMLIENS